MKVLGGLRFSFEIAELLTGQILDPVKAHMMMLHGFMKCDIRFMQIQGKVLFATRLARIFTSVFRSFVPRFFQGTKHTFV